MPFDLSPSRRIFALVDCNNFYASCERVVDPSLIGKPVVVLSNNDGCAIARSYEAKALGIKMAQPFFQWKHLIKEHGIRVCSANFALYGDMSERVMQTLDRFSPDKEVYSVDEAFLGLETLGIRDLEAYGRDIRQGVLHDTGLPVSVGIASTKTLSKLANHFAKGHPQRQGVCLLLSPAEAERVMHETPVGEVWGIGAQSAKVLLTQGIRTAWDLRSCDERWIKRKLSVVTVRTVFELRGISCMALADIPPLQQSISFTRTFAREITSLDEIEELVISYTARAAESLRAQGQLTGWMQVFLATSPFKPDYYANGKACKLDPRTDYTPTLTGKAREIIKDLYRRGMGYKRAGVVLGDFASREEIPRELFIDAGLQERQEKLMETVDKLNARLSGKAVYFAGEKQGGINRKAKSPTTQWTDLPQI